MMSPTLHRYVSALRSMLSCTSLTVVVGLSLSGCGGGSSAAPHFAAVTPTSVPGNPKGMTAQAIESNHVTLRWSGSAGDQPAVQYAVVRDGQTDRTLATTSVSQYDDLSVQGGKNYSYSIHTVRGDGSLSTPLDTVSVSTPHSADIMPPLPPASLTAQSLSSTRIDLVWLPSQDNIGVTKYLITRLNHQGVLAETTDTRFSDTTVKGARRYTYLVRAVDAANNQSGPSNTAQARTPASADTWPPTIPHNVAAKAISVTQVDLSWTESRDNSGVSKYQIARSGHPGILAETTQTSYRDATLTGSASYSYWVRALDASNNASNWSKRAATATPSGPDSVPPSTPQNFTASAPVATQVHLSWTAGTDNVGVAKYQVFKVGVAGVFAETTLPQYVDKTVVGASNYTYYVTALDAANNSSTMSRGASVTTPATPDKTAPSIPGGLTAIAPSATVVKLSWTASIDNVGVAKYRVFRSGSTAAVAETTTTSFDDSGVSPGTSYTYQVSAVDAANNASPLSAIVPVVTSTQPLGVRPTRENTGPRTALTDITPSQFMASRTCKNQRIVGDVELGSSAIGQTYTLTDCEITGGIYAYYYGNNKQPPLNEMPILVMTYTDVLAGIWLENLVKLTMDYSYSKGGQWKQSDGWDANVPGPAPITVTNSMFYFEKNTTTTAHTEALHVYTKASGFRFTNVAFVQQGPDTGRATASINFTGTDSTFDGCWFLWDGPVAAQFTVYILGTNNVVRNSWFAKGHAGYSYYIGGSTPPATYTNSHDVYTGQLITIP